MAGGFSPVASCDVFEVAVATVGDPPASQAARALLAMLPAGRHE